MPVALIIGITGQDGAYLARSLLAKGYTVHGTSRDLKATQLDRLSAVGVLDKINLHSLVPTDFPAVLQAIKAIAPNELFNLSGPSSVAYSFAHPAEAIESIALGTLNVLEAVRFAAPSARLYNAGSSEIFGDTNERPANEFTAYCPKSPYGVAKAAAVSLIRNYRESYRLYACSGILFNHDSPLRSESFVTRKITAAAVRIANGSCERLHLGKLSGRRDWGWAPDYVEAMQLILRHREPEDLVIATGQAHSLEEFVAAAFSLMGLDWRKHVDVDPNLKRPLDIEYSVGDASRAREILGWKPQATFPEIVKRMIAADQDAAAVVAKSMTY
jgi:GDPmannose 4,6-dehydratase